MAELDITKTGPVGLTGLKGLNVQNNKDNFDFDNFDFDTFGKNFKQSGFAGNLTGSTEAFFEPKHRDVNDPLASWGSSQYDTISGGMGDEGTLNESRFENQSTTDAMANALVKMMGTAATTFVSGVLNPIVGTYTAISEGRWSGLWDNSLTQALNDVDEYLEDNYKIYQSKEQQNADWLSAANLTSASFWGDDVIKNAGFMIGAAASGSTFTGGLGLASRAFGLAANASKAGGITTKILGSIFSAAGEGAIEAKNTMKDLVDLNNQKLDDALKPEIQAAYDEYERTKGTLVRRGEDEVYDPAYEKLKNTLSNIEEKRRLGQQKILEDARSAGNLDMALNIPILTLGNFITMGKGFTKSFENARRFNAALNRVDGSNLLRNPGKKAVREGAKTAFKNAANGEAINSGLETTVKGGAWKKGWKFVEPIVSEGSEEMNQQWASSLSGYYAMKEDPNDYWKAKMDPKSEQDAMSAWTAIGKGFFDSWGSYDQWEQFFVGGLTGAIGMPMPTKAFNQDKTKKVYNPARYFSWEGGSFQSLKEFKEQLNAATQTSEIVNRRINDPKFWNRIRSGVAHKYFQASMDEGVANDDIKQYKDSEEKQFVQDIEAFIKAGRLDDLITIISESTEDLSDDDIADLINRNSITVTQEQDAQAKREALSNQIDHYYNELKKLEEAAPKQEEQKKSNKSNKPKNLAEKRKENSQKKTNKKPRLTESDKKEQERLANINIVKSHINDLENQVNNIVGEEHKVSMYTDDSGNLIKSYDEIRQDLKRNGEKLKERVKSYTESIEFVNQMSNGRLTSDQEGNLAYLHYMGKAAKNRAENLIRNYEDAINQINTITLKTKESAKDIQKEYGLEEGSITQVDENTVNIDLTKLKSTEKETKALTFLKLGLCTNQESSMINATNLLNMLGEEDLESAARDIADAIKLNFDSMQFMNTFAEYMSDPTKVDEDKKKAEDNSKKEIDKSKIDNMKVSEVSAAMENGDLDLEGVDLDFDESDLAILNGEKPDATEEEKESAERKQKLNAAQGIVETKKIAKQKAREIAKDDAQYEELSRMFDEAFASAESSDDLFDLDSEAFNNPDALVTTEEEEAIAQMLQKEGATPEQIEETIREAKKQRLDEFKGILEKIKVAVEEDKIDLESMPKKEDIEGAELLQRLGDEKDDNKSRDPSGKAEVVNKGKTDNKTDKKGDNKDNPRTPDIESKTVLSDAPQSYNPTEEKGYWKMNTTEYPIHRDATNNDPYYTRVTDPKARAVYKAIYDYLQEVGAFARRNNNEVKKGQKVKFAISKKLNNAVGNTVLLILDENNNVIGDLPNPFDKTIFDSYPGLNDLYKDADNYFKEHSNDSNEDLVIIPNKESTIANIYIGRPLYTANKETHTLNEVADGKPFNLAIALTPSPNPNIVMEAGRRKNQGKTDEEMSIVPPENAKAGQPFLLIKTSDERRKWISVPISMPKFGEQSRNSKLYKIIVKHLRQLENPENFKDQGSLLKWKNDLKELLAVADIYVNFTKTGVTLRVRLKSTDTSWIDISKKEFNINDVINKLESLEIPFQISRRYFNNINIEFINVEFGGKSYVYNELIGELANVNLEIGALHSVNDFFTINPIIDGKEQKAKRIKDANKPTKEVIDDANKSRSIAFVEKIILPDQEKVDRSKTDSEFYYIKEEDGKYHKYSRVHSILPQNSNSTPSKNNRGINTGNAVDKIVRDFFNTGKTEKPELMSEVAYNTILEYLKYSAKQFKEKGWTVYANNIVLYQKYSDGRRVAGEVDLLLVDNEGNFHIVDIKTSAYSFYSDAFNVKHENWGQQMSTREYYTAQQSVYAQLFSDKYHKEVKSLSLLPFVIQYDDQNSVTGIVVENSIGLPIKNVNAYLFSAVTEDGKSPADDFLGLIGGLEDENEAKTDKKQEEEKNRKQEEDKKKTPKPVPEKPSKREDALNLIKTNSKLSRLFVNKEREALLNKLNDANLARISIMSPVILKKKLEELDTKIQPKMSNDDINKLVQEILKPRKREVTKGTKESSNIDKEVAKIKKIIPDLSEKDAITLVETIIKTEDGDAWGLFQDGLITIYKNAARGTAYHEAFHYVFNVLMDDSEVEKAYKSAKEQFGDLGSLELEEKMAEDFREYMQNEETFIGRLKNVWKNLKNFINKLRGKENYLNSLYFNISRGKYSNKNSKSTNGITRNRLVTKEELQRRVDSLVNNPRVNHTRFAINDAWGRLADSLLEQGIVMKGYYNKTYGKYIVASVKESPIHREVNIIRQYHRDKLNYRNLTKEQRDYLKERNISPETYNNMTVEEKEVLFECMY